MQRQALIFNKPGEVLIQQEDLPPGAPGQLLVETSYSAISAGTELLFYRGQVPPGMATDATIESLQQANTYPLRYGYQAVGRVIRAEAEHASWLDQPVFAFQPHQSHFWTDPAGVIALPPELPLEDALFLPNMESAVNFVQDGQPVLGERVVVLGQGVVGLLTTALLSQFPLAGLITVDTFEQRRQQSLAMGADSSLPPDKDSILAALGQLAAGSESPGADVVFELSGSPDALNLAVELAGFSGRIIVGSWYGTKQAPLALGGHFHRNRIQLVSSQVSSIRPGLQGRWTKSRRMASAQSQLRQVQPQRLITHRFPLKQADLAYKLLAEGTDQTIQVIFEYQ
jgi:2-desacetyl-2-hydroxyethyl bacteriochlorophyllide A dehydrogenase